jgi:hypothetical protein
VIGGTQLPPAQMSGDVQSALAEQLVLHAVVPHTYGLHIFVDGVMHAPLVLQLADGVRVEPVQVEPAQVVPDAYFWQPPVPSHLPLVPQVEAPVSVHWVDGVGAWPAGTCLQVPTLFVRLQAVQFPVQALLQQTLLTQKPDWQAAGVWQSCPTESLPQLLATQVAGALQSALVEQVVLQAPLEPQPQGSQSVDVTVWQVPAPSQVAAAVNTSPEQVDGMQTVSVP